MGSAIRWSSRSIDQVLTASCSGQGQARYVDEFGLQTATVQRFVCVLDVETLGSAFKRYAVRIVMGAGGHYPLRDERQRSFLSDPYVHSQLRRWSRRDRSVQRRRMESLWRASGRLLVPRRREVTGVDERYTARKSMVREVCMKGYLRLVITTGLVLVAFAGLHGSASASNPSLSLQAGRGAIQARLNGAVATSHTIASWSVSSCWRTGQARVVCTMRANFRTGGYCTDVMGQVSTQTCRCRVDRLRSAWTGPTVTPRRGQGPVRTTAE